MLAGDAEVARGPALAVVEALEGAEVDVGHEDALHLGVEGEEAGLGEGRREGDGGDDGGLGAEDAVAAPVPARTAHHVHVLHGGLHRTLCLLRPVPKGPFSDTFSTAIRGSSTRYIIRGSLGGNEVPMPDFLRRNDPFSMATLGDKSRREGRNVPG